MNGPGRLATAVLTASAALMLSACGSGGGDDSSSDKIKGTDTDDGAASASPSASASLDGVKRPEITLPKEFQANFESWTNSDPKKQAILNDGRERLKAEYLAVIDAEPASETVSFYSTGQALTSARTWIQGYVKNAHTLIGEARIFNPQVTISDSGGGVLFYCVDEGKGYTKDRKTKEVEGTPDGVNPVLQYRTTLERTPQGVWKTKSLETERGGCGQ
ncbi:hypothetical protein [Streptomyces violarus]|uniref:hypothetical protein n=1 Tax=Streptomyces violarus TaxID=67380 RepID=UPI0021C16A53|nr:hypothetical protein [Streptomyces violarus]MCT9139504.1 hypothetical protein [Streptomyces violarus]